VLVVDDSPVYRKLVEQVLAAEPSFPALARNGVEAMDLYQQHSPCMVITDWMMPDFSGLELCQRIRSDSTRSYTYVILMTSNTEKGNVVKGLQAGADDYLTKPFDLGEMLARIGVGWRIIDLNREARAEESETGGSAYGSLNGITEPRAIEVGVAAIAWSSTTRILDVGGAGRH
jgi:sigma-B regulation protein RsbU (phosphoserine phosphatase)